MLKIVTDEQLRDLVPSFIENRKSDIIKMKRALELGDLDRVKWINHDIQGCAIPFGFTVLDGLSKKLSASYDNSAEALLVLNEMQYHIENVKVA